VEKANAKAEGEGHKYPYFIFVPSYSLWDSEKVKPSSFTNTFNYKMKRPLLALQVEVTSRCTRSCLPCPRSDLRRDWRNGDLEDAYWAAIEPGLRLTYHVHLQGWGEPLLHPMLPVQFLYYSMDRCYCLNSLYSRLSSGTRVYPHVGYH
jgi:hypothetical protein